MYMRRLDGMGDALNPGVISTSDPFPIAYMPINAPAVDPSLYNLTPVVTAPASVFSLPATIGGISTKKLLIGAVIAVAAYLLLSKGK